MFSIDPGSPDKITPDQIIAMFYKIAQRCEIPKRNRTVIYVRKSRVLKNSQYLSPAIQEKDCRELAAKSGMEVVEVIADLDKTGKNSDRPGLQKILGMVKAGEVDYVLMQYIDRSYRNGVSMLKFFELLQQYRAQIISVNEKIDTRQFGGRILLFMLAVAAELPIFTASERGRSAAKALREQGRHRGGYRFGYCNGLCSNCTDPNGVSYCPYFGRADRPESQRGKIQVPHPIEQHGVRLIVYLYHSLWSSYEISEYLKDNLFIVPGIEKPVKFRTKGNGLKKPGDFKPEAIQDIIRNVFYIGYVAHYPTPPLSMLDDLTDPKSVQPKVKNKKTPIEFHKGLHEALYPFKIWEQNQHIRKSRGKTPTSYHTPKRVYPLSGIAHCWECMPFETKDRSITLRGVTNGSKDRVYICSAMHKRSKDSKLVLNNDLSTLTSLGISSQVNLGTNAIKARHVKSNLKAQDLEDGVDAIVSKLVIPLEWQERIMAYYLSDDGMSEYKRRRFNLQSEIQLYQTQHLEHLIDDATLRTQMIRIGQELAKLTPANDARAMHIKPLLNDFKSLWKTISPGDKRSMLKIIFERIYIDSTGTIREMRARAPFDKLLNLS